MAGGSAGDIRAPWPKGANALILIQAPCTIVASKSKDFITHRLTAQFAFKPVRATYAAQDVIVASAITVNIQDDTGTPKEIVTDYTVPAITGGAGSELELTVDKSLVINAGAQVDFSYGSGAGDSSVDGVMNLWVQPIN